jgi:hypothetical protein
MSGFGTIVSGGFVALALAGAASAGAGNLLVNAELDLDVLDWDERTPSISELDWHTLDADACGNASGSALAQNWGIVASTTAIFEQCVPGIVVGETYSLAAWLRFPSGQTQSGHAYVQIQFMEQEDCLGETASVPSNSSQLQSGNSDVWVRRQVESAIAPAGATAARVGITLSKDSHTGNLDLHFDRLYFGPGPGIVFQDGFETDSLCRWSAEAP